MSAQYLVVDIDQTICNSALPWWTWMGKQCERPLEWPHEGEITYELYHYFKEDYMSWMGVDESHAIAALYEWWEGDSIYSDLEAIRGCKNALQRASERGWWITFASYTKKGHMGSKFDFLCREFPFIEWDVNGSFVATQEKGCLKADIVIDDRHKYLNQQPDRWVMKLLYSTPYTQDEELSVDVDVINHWGKLEDYLDMWEVRKRRGMV